MPRAREPLSETLPGTWELLARIDVTSDGHERAEPMLGSDPVAMLFYDRSGHFAAQFMKRDRTERNVDQAGAGGANNSRPIGGYDAYFGEYAIDDRTGVVRQTLRGALSAESVGLVVERAMEVDGDRLTISLQTTAEGASVTRILTWKRVG